MSHTETATLGGGCFWCLEAVYQEVQGVREVVSGYMGGSMPNPSYKDVCTGTTGHVEVVQVTFDPAVIPFRDILEIFFSIHDPTSRDRQGNDVGPQYRSVIFYHSDEQRRTAEEVMRAAGPGIVTELRPAEAFYAAGQYHQNYFRDNPDQPYCSYVVAPKLRKFRQKFKSKISTGAQSE